MENIFLTGFSDDERHSAINKIQNTVSKYGDIADFHLFSDISLSLAIEIEEYKIDKLLEELRKIIGIQKSEYLNSISTKERTVYLNITFTKGTGNLKIEVPSVPG
jgi:phage-related tail protein